MTRILRELVERGLVQRAADAADGRRTIVVITPEGRDLVQRTSGETLKLLTAYIGSFGEARLEALIAELHALALAIEPFANTDATPDIEERRIA
jgi:DNA-binding MarR family transcriptional regulator